MLRAIFTAIALLLWSGVAAYPEQFSLQRGYANYQRVLSGEIAFQSLTEIERQEILFVVQSFRSNAPSDASDECKEAYEDADDASDQLVSTAQRLESCAESKQFDSDDCSTEMRRARSAHSDYESAVSEVQSECD